MVNGYNLIQTDWGYIVAVWSDRGLWGLSLPRPNAESALAGIDIQDVSECGDNLYLDQLCQELRTFFLGFPGAFGVPVDWRGYTPFQAAALKYAAAIPYGQTRTYREAAIGVGAPKAARAIGAAMNKNRTPIVIPCHRVIGSDGALTGFGGGIELKKALLLLEQAKD